MQWRLHFDKQVVVQKLKRKSQNAAFLSPTRTRVEPERKTNANTRKPNSDQGRRKRFECKPEKRSTTGQGKKNCTTKNDLIENIRKIFGIFLAISFPWKRCEILRKAFCLHAAQFDSPSTHYTAGRFEGKVHGLQMLPQWISVSSIFC